jgi:hypothetical protein
MSARQDRPQASASDSEILSRVSPGPLGNPRDAARRDVERILGRHAENLRKALRQIDT